MGKMPSSALDKLCSGAGRVSVQAVGMRGGGTCPSRAFQDWAGTSLHRHTLQHTLVSGACLLARLQTSRKAQKGLVWPTTKEDHHDDNGFLGQRSWYLVLWVELCPQKL